MATVSARIDNEIKKQAEDISNKLGISLSTAIIIFLKKYIANQGFPFELVVSSSKSFDREKLDLAINSAIINAPDDLGRVNSFTYFDPETKKIITVNKNKEA